MRILVAIGFALGGCVNTSAVQCTDGTLCPENTACAAEFALCVNPSQLAECSGAMLADACTLPDGSTGNCQGDSRVCLPIACGNGRVDRGEACDAAIAGTTCSTDCLSTGACGNAIRDAFTGEQCDEDMLLVDHDGCSSRCEIETLDWYPGEVFVDRLGQAAAWDPRRRRVVVFGGPSPDTWEWNGATWHIVTTISPPARYDGAMVYDRGRGAVVLIGGKSVNGVERSDVWAFDGHAWTQLPSLPIGVRAPMAAYDGRRDRIVVFGGNEATKFSDATYALDATGWHEIVSAAHPSGRTFSAVTYDPIRDRVVLFGGTNNTTTYDDLWELDGDTWSSISVAGPNPTALGTFSFDPARGASVLIGGLATPGGLESATAYAWNGVAWSVVLDDDNLARQGHVAVATDRGIFVFAGVNYHLIAIRSGYLDGAHFEFLEPVAIENFRLAEDRSHGRVMLYGGVDAVSGLPVAETWLLDQIGWHHQSAAVGATRPVIDQPGRIVFDRARGEFVAFGGYGPDISNATWTWSETTGWIERHPATSPSPRTAFAMVYDVAHARTILVGGENANGKTIGPEDVWAWDGTTWTAIVPTTPMTPPHSRIALGYDEDTGTIVAFGGTREGVLEPPIFDDTWTFDGTTWTKAPIGDNRPAASKTVEIVWDETRHALVLVDVSTSSTEAWAWNSATSSWDRIGTPHHPPIVSGFGAFAAIDGDGIVLLRGRAGGTPAERVELRYQGPGGRDECSTGYDGDGDHRAGCDDLDCLGIFGMCATCGDGVCDPRETCRACARDCACTPICGDQICDPGETCPGDCP